jgi:DNA-binding Lrp family transcriptional regulator
MVDPFALGYGMLAFLEISLNNQSDQHMQDFEQRMAKEAEVMQCYFVSANTTISSRSTSSIWMPITSSCGGSFQVRAMYGISSRASR